MKTKIAGKDLHLTLNHCIALMRGTVAQYRCAGNMIYNTGVYTRGRTHMQRPAEGNTACVDIYYMNEFKEIVTLCYNTKPHRAKQLKKALLDGTINNIDDAIIQNYATNGYSTVAGLFRNAISIKRIKEIARSHANYMGSETGNSKFDHQQRVILRKNY